MMQALLSGFDSALAALRYALLGAAAVLAAIGGVDWLVRTRKISPFSPVARFMRASVDPLLRPIERRVVRAGGLPSSAPWWALGALVLAGIILLALLGVVRSEVAFIYDSLTGGTHGIYRLLVTLIFTILELALIVRVILSWLPLSPVAWYARWSHALTEPILRPLRRFIPRIGMMDVTPIIAWFLLGFLQGFFLTL
jgi:YggT family protein